MLEHPAREAPPALAVFVKSVVPGICGQRENEACFGSSQAPSGACCGEDRLGKGDVGPDWGAHRCPLVAGTGRTDLGGGGAGGENLGPCWRGLRCSRWKRMGLDKVKAQEGS